jgi:hypothetical protein
MRRFLILLCIFGPSVVIAVWVSALRSTQVSPDQAEMDHRTGVVIVPAGTRVRIRLVGGFSNAAESGDLRQAITSVPTAIGTQTLIPEETRALVRVLAIEEQPERKARVTLQLQSLMSQNRKIPVHSNVITAELNRESDLNVMSRAGSGMIGGAIGAAGSGVLKNDPNMGAVSIGGLAAGTDGEDGAAADLVFQILDPVDLTGIRW